MSSLRKPFLFVALAVAVTSLSACGIGGIGNGNKLETLEIQRVTALVDRSSNVSYQCFSDKLQVVGTFTNGGQADYSARALWRSSNPDVVAVSNGDILFPGSTTTAFASGTIVPKSEGTATVTAEFVGLSAQYEVEVRKLPDDAVQITTTDLTLAPETIGALGLTATVDGYLLNVTQAASWSFVDEDDTIATIGSGSGVIAAVGPGGPLRARAEFPLCDDGNGGSQLTFEADVSVDELTGLTLEREFKDMTNDELVVGTSEVLKVTGSFANGATQDLGVQVVLQSDNEEVASSLVLFPNLVSALTAGTANLTAVYGRDTDDNGVDDYPPELQSNSITLNSVEGELQDFTIEPLNDTTNALTSLQYSALGTFSVNGETLQQPITRGVFWTVTTQDDAATADVSVSNSLGSAGRAVSLVPQEGTYKITATRGSGETAIAHDTVLCVVTPGTEDAECPPADASATP